MKKKKKILTINLTLTIFTKLCACTWTYLNMHQYLLTYLQWRQAILIKEPLWCISPAVKCLNDHRVSKWGAGSLGKKKGKKWFKRIKTQTRKSETPLIWKKSSQFWDSFWSCYFQECHCWTFYLFFCPQNLSMDSSLLIAATLVLRKTWCKAVIERLLHWRDI